MRNAVRVMAVVLCAAALGCAPRKPRPPQDDLDLPAKKVMAIPFSLTVSQEMNDGSRLYIKAAIEAQARWSTDDILLKLTGFRNGEAAGEQVAALEALGPVLQAGEKREVPIVLEASNVTDYQLELVWGADRKAVMPDISAESAAESGLGLRNLSISTERINCKDESDCELKFTISGELFNGSNNPVDHAVLGTGFLWAEGGKLDLSGGIPENESRIELSGLGLGPGASRRVRLVLDQTVPERMDGAYKPVLRVISIDSPGTDPAILDAAAQ